MFLPSAENLMISVFFFFMWTLPAQGPDGKPLVDANGEQVPVAASSMIRSHSVSGDLHGVQPDPIAADILRKEPEHEIFTRLRISPIGIKFSYLF